MSRTAWKWFFGISLTLLVLLMIFVVGIWALGNATAALAMSVMSYTNSDAFDFQGITFDAFVVNAIGSPIFYAFLIDMVLLTVSFVMLIVTRDNGSNHAA